MNENRFLIQIDTGIMDGPSELKSKIPLKLNLSIIELQDINQIRKSSASFVGSKAANFGELNYLSKKCNFKTPESAFAIPFYFYLQHLKSSGASILIKELLGNLELGIKEKEDKLIEIQKCIEGSPLDTVFLRTVEDKINSAPFNSFRFRSSTNAEDITGFSGAGLYKSKGVKLNSIKKTASQAIKEVWASAWSLKAFRERDFYAIDQSQVAMGILVHRSFPDEKVNGVALTKNIYRRNSAGFVINIQKGNENVVSQNSSIVPEQFICFPSKFKKPNSHAIIDVITYSSLSEESLLSETETQNLANQLELIKRHFTKPQLDTWSYHRLGFDIEFKINTEARQLYIKQLRPYND